MKHTRVVSTKCTPGFACRAFSDTTLVCFIVNEHTTKCSRYNTDYNNISCYMATSGKTSQVHYNSQCHITKSHAYISVVWFENVGLSSWWRHKIVVHWLNRWAEEWLMIAKSCLLGKSLLWPILLTELAKETSGLAHGYVIASTYHNICIYWYPIS